MWWTLVASRGSDVTTILFAGADVRVNPDLPDPTWDERRREAFLIRTDVRRPLSLDTTVWPRPARVDGQPVEEPLPWVGVESVRRRWAQWQPDGDRAWVIVAIGAVAADTDAREKLANGSGIDTELVADPNWRFLGFDIVDGSISGLTNCGFEPGELEGLRGWAPRINDHGLLSDLSDTLSFRLLTDRRVPEHAPFEVCGLWLVP
jgi:hypothetical protein